MFNTRKATAQDYQYRAKLQALQQEQAGLNRRIKVQRERHQAITAEFFAVKKEWNQVMGDNGTIIEWS